jgi:Protein of unknown function (DUF3617)
MKLRALLCASACALAACSPPASQNNTGNGGAGAPTPPPAASVASALQPGQYRTTVTIVSMDMPGMPANMVQQMRARPNVTEDCMTSDDVAELTRKSLVNEDSGQHCTENNVSAANGHIEGTATCSGPEGGSFTMHMNGNYAANHVEMDMDMSGQTPMGPMTQRMHMVSERIGVCSEGGTN